MNGLLSSILFGLKAVASVLAIAAVLGGGVLYSVETRAIATTAASDVVNVVNSLNRIEAKLNKLTCMVRQINDPLCYE